VSPTLSLSSVFTTSGHLACYSFPLFYGVYAMYIYMCIYIYLHMLIYKKNCALTFPRPPIPGCYEMGFSCLDGAHGASMVRAAFRRSS
jgi:hypothetical protein